MKKAAANIISKIKMPSDSIGITCLSIEEAKALPKKLLKHDWRWWLRSPGSYRNNAAIVRDVGSVNYYGDTVNYGNDAVRPALVISDLESLNLKFGDEVEVFDKRWTVISDNLLLCDTDIGESPFRKDREAPDANVWEVSDLKAYCETWLANAIRDAENED